MNWPICADSRKQTRPYRVVTQKQLFTLIELLVNTSQHNCFSLLLKSPQLP